MKIVFYTQEFNLNSGKPCTKRIDSLATYLVKKNYDVVVLTGSHNKKNEVANLKRDYKVVYCPIFALGKRRNIYRFIEHTSFAFFSSVVGIFKLGKVDYLVTTTPPPLISFTGYFLSKIKRAKLIYDVRDIWPDVAVEMKSFDEKSFYYKVFNFIAKFMYKHSDYITTVTPRKVEKLKGYVDETNKVKYISNGLDDNFIRFKVDLEIVKKYNLDKKFTITYVGNVGLAQNLEVLVDLAKKYKKNKNMQFLIFGDGVCKTKILNMINELKLTNIKLLDRVNYEKVYTILKYSKISFISLKNDNMLDSIPTKIYDSLGAGCPVLLFAKGDSCDLLDEMDYGEYTCDEKELYEKLELMINNYDKYVARRDEVISKTMKKYSRERIAKKFEREVLKNDK